MLLVNEVLGDNSLFLAPMYLADCVPPRLTRSYILVTRLVDSGLAQSAEPFLHRQPTVRQTKLANRTDE